MEKAVSVHYLTSSFYQRFPSNIYPEIVQKANRPYACLLVPFRDNIQICIPYRSNIRHSNSYHFKSSRRSAIHQSGLDYSKIVFTTDASDIETATAVIDQDEYRETVAHIGRIRSDVISYVNDYVGVKNGTIVLHPREYTRRYAFSTLPYFEYLLLQ